MTPKFKTALRTAFHAFVRKAFRKTHGEKLGNQPYLALLCAYLQQLAEGEIKLLQINLPPRHLKTFVASICLVAWILGREPSARIMLVTCSDKLSQRIAYQVRQLMKSPWYKETFKTRLAPDRTQVADFATTKGGGLYAVSIDGSMTGYGADFIFVDDPLDIKDACNAAQITKVNERFDGLIRSRLNNQKEGCIAHIAHRLNEGDLSGHLSDEKEWTRVVLPLVAPRRKTYKFNGVIFRRGKGDLLRPDAFTPKILKKLHGTLINPDFETLYQQNPGGAHSFRIKEAHFPTARLKRKPDLPLIISVDPGQGGGPSNSFSVIQVWQWMGEQYGLLHQWRQRAPYSEVLFELSKLVTWYRPWALLIETPGWGEALIPAIRKKRAWLNVVPVTPDGRSKGERLGKHAKTIRARKVVHAEGAEWRRDFIDEATQFPRAPFSDQVDAMTQFLDFISSGPELHPPPAQALAVVGSKTQPVPTDARARQLDGQAPGVVVGVSRGYGYRY